jgi:mersacidin/lichenicidin family type 2 lantibiotic
MSHVNVVRAWKDEEYRNGLTEAERARLPENPAGLLEQTEAELERAVGGYVVTVYGCGIIPVTNPNRCFLVSLEPTIIALTSRLDRIVPKGFGG